MHRRNILTHWPTMGISGPIRATRATQGLEGTKCSGRYNRRLGKAPGRAWHFKAVLHTPLSLLAGRVAYFRSGMAYCPAPALPPTAGSLVPSRESCSGTIVLPGAAVKVMFRDEADGINMSLGHVSIAVA